MKPRAPITHTEKQIIKEQKASGKRLREISLELGCSSETVRKWWRCERDQRKPQVRGRPKRGPMSTYAQAVVERAIEIKKGHPHWGPEMVKIEMAKEAGLKESKLPSAARLSVLFKQRCPEAVQPHQRRMQPPSDPKVRQAHDRWQMDAKEGLHLGNERVNVQEIRDCYSGLMITSQAFITSTPTFWRHLSRAENQQALRTAFGQWGLPREVQTDHDGEFVNITDPTFPSPFTLWLVGLGITHVLSRPHRPTDQAQIERTHRSQGDFVWKDQIFEGLDQFQRALNQQCQSYNQEYPSHAGHCDGLPPLSAFPFAKSTGRSYHPALEWSLFDLQRVYDYLAQFTWSRKVAANGAVHLGGFYYLLGLSWKTHSVSIRFLPACTSFRFESEDGTVIAILPAQGLDKLHLIGEIPDIPPVPVDYQLAFTLSGV
jgi:transposase InsO family protein